MLDHLVYGTPDLAATVTELDDRLGVRLQPGGQHLGFGTRNYLADLGERRYLEVVGPDPDQPEPAGPRLFGVDALSGAHLVTWAARVTDLDDTVRRAAAAGLAFTPPNAMARELADGSRISWRLAMPLDVDEYSGLIPFLIQWDGSAHPADDAVRGAQLEELTGFTPDAMGAQSRLAAIGQELRIEQRAQPGLRAMVRCPAGRVVLE